MTREPDPTRPDEEAPGAVGPPPGAREAAVESPEPEPAAKPAPEDFAAFIAGETGPRRAADYRPWRVSHLMILIVAVAVLLWLVVTLRTLGLVLLPIGLLVLAITAGFVTARLGASRQEALLTLLAIASERDMPLAPAVSAFADQFGGRSQRRILGVVDQLEAGEPLPEALERPHRVVSRDAILMARVGHQTGRLATALRLVGSSREARITAWTAVVSRLTYLLLVMIGAEAVSGFLLYFVLPKFEAIFKDFDVPLPALTILVIQSAYVLVKYAPLTLSIFLAQVVLLIFLPFSYGGWINYRVPVFDRLLARRHAALVLRALSLAIEADRPIGPSLQILAERYPARWVRRRLARVSLEVQMGADWIDALWRAGVIRRSDAEVLASASSVGNLVWACRELSDTAERRNQLRVQLLIQMLFPLVIIAMGVAVVTLCLGYFLPLVFLIQRLSG